METVGEILSGEKKLKHILQEASIVQKLKKNIDGVFGKLKKDIDIGYIKDKILILEVRNPLWTSEIALFEQMIIDNANSIIGKKYVKSLKIKSVFDSKSYTQHKVKKRRKSNLLECIQSEITDRMNSGQHLCSHCQQSFTADAICIFCKNTV